MDPDQCFCILLCDAVRAHNDYRLAARLRTPIVLDDLDVLVVWQPCNDWHYFYALGFRLQARLVELFLGSY